MVEQHMPELSLLDRVKIQAEVVIPLFHAFEAELGTERAQEVVGAALRDHFRNRFENGGTRRDLISTCS